jgi:aspartyl aminopeptidase
LIACFFLTKNGKRVDITIGEDESDPVFVIPDLLPHLSRVVQDDRKAREVIKGEELIVIIGSMPSKIDDKDVKTKVKYAVMQKLNEKYGMIEEDFISAEFELVPAAKRKASRLAALREE